MTGIKYRMREVYNHMIITIGSKVKDKNGETYLLTEELGHGGFGCVYKAICEKDKTECAVKTLLYSFANEEAARSFKNEIILSRKVSGDNVIRYIYAHDGEEYPELPPYIIMEYASGGTLREKIEKRKRNNMPFSNDELLSIYKQLISGMASINAELVHRDIKPENILICDDTLKISDFGLAKISSESTRTMSFKGYGTLPYIAPEAWNSDKNTIQMDIYSMGIVFYELATFEYPYEIKSNDVESYKNAHLFSRIKNTVELQKSTSVDIASIIMTMLEKPTQKRFKAWEDIEKQLDKESSVIPTGMSNIVSLAISKKILKDTQEQQWIEDQNRKKKEKEDFCNLVKTQFEGTVIDCISRFVDQYNEHSSSVDKCKIIGNSYRPNLQELFQHQLNIPSVANITIKCKVVFPESESRTITMHEAYRYGDGTKTIKYTPQYKNRNIMGWVEIENSKGFGFNMWLIQSDGIYGDWYILRNKNNLIYLTQRTPMKEPFAFSIDNMSEALKGISATSMFSSTVEPFKEEAFWGYFGELIQI